MSDKKDLIAMKIERISNNEIKFTLTESDLRDRDMRLNELSYGSEKTQELFREIMERAAIECDFHTSHETPLIIEAIPVDHGSIMILVTKVANPGDLKGRLGYPPILGNHRNVSRTRQKKGAVMPPPLGADAANQRPSHPKHIIFEFQSFENVTNACLRVSGTYIGSNALFKYADKYYLVFENDNVRMSAGQENILKEYSNKFSSLEISKMFLLEHGEMVVDGNAVGILSSVLG